MKDAARRTGRGGEAASRKLAVMFTVRVATAHLKDVREALHRALGATLDVYVMSVDHRNGIAALQLEIASTRLHETMGVIMKAVPEAEFGTVRPSRR